MRYLVVAGLARLLILVVAEESGAMVVCLGLLKVKV